MLVFLIIDWLVNKSHILSMNKSSVPQHGADILTCYLQLLAKSSNSTPPPPNTLVNSFYLVEMIIPTNTFCNILLCWMLLPKSQSVIHVNLRSKDKYCGFISSDNQINVEAGCTSEMQKNKRNCISFLKRMLEKYWYTCERLYCTCIS